MATIQKEFGAQMPVEDTIKVESIANLTAILKRNLGSGS
jgi:acyl carrier protein